MIRDLPEKSYKALKSLRESILELMGMVSRQRPLSPKVLLPALDELHDLVECAEQDIAEDFTDTVRAMVPAHLLSRNPLNPKTKGGSS